VVVVIGPSAAGDVVSGGGSRGHRRPRVPLLELLDREDRPVQRREATPDQQSLDEPRCRFVLVGGLSDEFHVLPVPHQIQRLAGMI